jgi:predicted dehydrogenase
MIKIGLIGAGFMGGMHGACYEALLGKEDFMVTAVADRDVEKAGKIAKKFGAKVFASGEELLEDADVNTVDICLPTYLHTSHALKTMGKGYNVLIEKPVCLHEGEAWQLLEMKKKTGVKVMVGQCIRFWDEYVYLKELIDQKTYGQLISAVFKRISPKPGWSWEGWILDSSKSGSAVLDLHIHDVDYVRYIMGMPDTIKSEITCIDGDNEHAFALYGYKDAVVSIEGGWNYPSGFPFEMEYRVNFEKGTAVFNSNRNPSLWIYEDSGKVIQPEIEKSFESESEGLGGNISSLGGYYNEIKYFLECLSKNCEIEIASLEDGIESFRLIKKEIEAAVNEKKRGENT